MFDQVTPLLKGEIRAPVSLEGGDMLVLSDKVLAIGCSERTSADAVHLLAENLRDHFRRGETTFEHLLMVLMPKVRSAMHLDTVFTRTSHDECLVFPPFFSGQSRELLTAFRGSSVPVIAKAADGDPANPLYALDARAYDLWALGAGLPAGLMYQQRIVKC